MKRSVHAVFGGFAFCQTQLDKRHFLCPFFGSELAKKFFDFLAPPCCSLQFAKKIFGVFLAMRFS